MGLYDMLLNSSSTSKSSGPFLNHFHVIYEASDLPHCKLFDYFSLLNARGCFLTPSLSPKRSHRTQPLRRIVLCQLCYHACL